MSLIISSRAQFHTKSESLKKKKGEEDGAGNIYEKFIFMREPHSAVSHVLLGKRMGLRFRFQSPIFLSDIVA